MPARRAGTYASCLIRTRIRIYIDTRICDGSNMHSTAKTTLSFPMCDSDLAHTWHWLFSQRHYPRMAITVFPCVAITVFSCVAFTVFPRMAINSTRGNHFCHGVVMTSHAHHTKNATAEWTYKWTVLYQLDKPEFTTPCSVPPVVLVVLHVPPVVLVVLH